MDCYANCNEVIDQYLDVQVSTAQVHRVTDTYGQEIGKTVNEHTTLTPPNKEEVLYIEADGSMVLTREEGWKEVKLGRVFKSSDCIHAAGKPGWISNSQYVAHLGGHKDPKFQMEHLIDNYQHKYTRLIFITDGAPWLKNWIEDAYPDSISILDYYHASEYLHAFAREHFKNEEQKAQWLAEQKELLSEEMAKKIVENVRQIESPKKEAIRLIEYYEANLERMRYNEYSSIGCGIIGSGAIESANRKVIQKRMKQSGQRWSLDGAQNMLNLRVTKCNGCWDKIVALTKTEFKRAA